MDLAKIQKQNEPSGKHFQKVENIFQEFPILRREQWEDAVQKELKGYKSEADLAWPLEEGEFLFRDGEKTHLLAPYYCSDSFQEGIISEQEDCDATDNNGTNRWIIFHDIFEESLTKAKTKEKLLKELGLEGSTFILSGSLHPFLRRTFLEGKQSDEREEGWSISSQEELNLLLKQDDPNQKEENQRKDPIYISCGMDSPRMLTMLCEKYEKYPNAKDPQTNHKKNQILLDYDIFSHWLAKGFLSCSYEDSMKVALELAQKSQKYKIRPLCISGEIFQYAGASPLQVIALMLAAAHEYIVYAVDHEREQQGEPQGNHLKTNSKKKSQEKDDLLSSLLSSLWFCFPLCDDYFLEIARLRVVSLLWTRILSQYLSPENLSQDQLMYKHGKVTLYNKTLYDSYNNVLRTSTESMAAITGGVNSLSCLPFDSLWKGGESREGEGSTHGERLALQTQMIHRHEAHLDRTTDPAGGSWFFEQLTDTAGQKIWSYFQEIEAEGGLRGLIQDGRLQHQLELLGKKRKDEISQGKKPFLGVNCFPSDPKKDPMLSSASTNGFHLKNHFANQKIAKPEKNAGQKTDSVGGSHCSSFLKHITPSVPARESGGHSVVNSLDDSLAARVPPLSLARPSEYIESLRLASEAYMEREGIPPNAVLLLFGSPTTSKARANFIGSFLGCAGYSTQRKILLDSSREKEEEKDFSDLLEEAVLSLPKGGILAFCSNDESYSDKMPQITAFLEGLSQNTYPCLPIIVAHPQKLKGASEDRENGASLNQAFRYIHQGSDLVEELTWFHTHLGIL